jgi:hypothetical protein
MGTENKAYAFPHEEEEEEVIDTAEEELEVELEVDDEPAVEEPDDGGDDEADLEIIDDTPEEDQGRVASDPPADITDEELVNYNKKAQARIKHFSKGYHDQRRDKETAQRQSAELEIYARGLQEENQRLQGASTQNQAVMLEQAKKTVGMQLEAAKKQYREAYDAGEPDAIVAAQEAMTTATIRAEKLNGIKPQPLQKPKTDVQQEHEGKSQPQQAPVYDAKAAGWQEQNTWFGSDKEMTAFALGLHSKLTDEEGINPKSDIYYQRIDARMREVFPDTFDNDSGTKEKKVQKKKSSNVVAPAKRSVKSPTIRLSKTEQSIADRLNVPYKVYAQNKKRLQELENS